MSERSCWLDTCTGRDEGGWISSGGPFHSRGGPTASARSPSVLERDMGTVNSFQSEDLRLKMSGRCKSVKNKTQHRWWQYVSALALTVRAGERLHERVISSNTAGGPRSVLLTSAWQMHNICSPNEGQVFATAHVCMAERLSEKSISRTDTPRSACQMHRRLWLDAE